MIATGCLAIGEPMLFEHIRCKLSTALRVVLELIGSHEEGVEDCDGRGSEAEAPLAKALVALLTFYINRRYFQVEQNTYQSPNDTMDVICVRHFFR